MSNYSMVEWVTFLTDNNLFPAEFFSTSDQWGSRPLGETIKTAYGTGTSGIYNKRYGTEAVVNIIYSEDIHGLSAKRPYLKSGHPLVSAAAATTGGGVALGGGVPVGDVRTYSQAYTIPKIHAKTVDITTTYRNLEGKDDMISSDQLIRDGGSEWKDLIDRALCTHFDTLAGNNLESYDRLTASSVEQAACGETAADEDFMGIDKSANTWDNPYVSHGSNAPRPYKLKFIEDAYAAVGPYAKGPRKESAIVLQTGFDTYWRTAEAVGPSIWRQPMDVAITVNGVTTDKGTPYNTRVPSIHNSPLFMLNHIKQSTISWLYGINQDFAYIKILAPPAVAQTDNIKITQYFMSSYTYHVEEELATDLSKASFKVRDLV